MTCGKNHIDIFWIDGAKCPVCDALEDLERLSAEFDQMQAQMQARRDLDVRVIKDGK